MPAGLVVAGGYSTRFGLAEKALVEVGGEPMLGSVVRALDAVVDEVVIDCRSDQVAPFETALESSGIDADPTFVVDDEPDRGPIAGLANGLTAIGHETTMVASCDRPGVTPALFTRLENHRRARGADAAVPECDGILQPLCGAYRTDRLATAADAAVRAGDRRLLRIPAALGAFVLAERSLREIIHERALESVDEPLDASRYPVARGRRPADDADRGTVPDVAARASD